MKVYLYLNIIVSILHFVFIKISAFRLKKHYLERLKNGPKTIPPLIYYSAIFFKLILAVLFFPSTFIFYLFYLAKRSQANICYNKYRPVFEYENAPFGEQLHSFYCEDDYKPLFHCNYFDSYNSGQIPNCPFFCQRYCPLFHSSVAKKYSYSEKK